MKLNEQLSCTLPCVDVNKDLTFPKVDIDPKKIKIILISEAPPIDKRQYYYQPGSPYFFETTRQAFEDAGLKVKSVDELLKKGIYLTTAIKCSKNGYLVSSSTLKECSFILERELDQFPDIKVVLCMGDFAIKCIDYIYRRRTGKGVIPAGSTYKIRSGVFESGGIRFLPSYTQTGDSYNIEKSKKRMIGEDIKKALDVCGLK